MSFGLILTAAGASQIELAYQAGEVIRITVVALGDGGGAAVTPDPAVTELVNPFGEVPFSQGGTESGMISGQAVINARDYPGKVVREFGLMSADGVLIAYGAYPETYLPDQSDAIIKELVVNFVMPLAHTECVELVVDPNIAILTQEEGDKRYYRRELRLQEVQDEGAEAQQELRENIGCGTSATKDVVTSPTDTTAGRVLAVGAGGLLGTAPRTANAASASYDNIPTGLASGFWTHAASGGPYAYTFTLRQDGGGKVESRHLIIPSDPNGKIAFRWDGASAAGKDYQYFYTDKNKPTPGDINAFPSSPNSLTVDLNTLGAMTSEGVYYQTTNTGATAANHYPAQAAGTLFVTRSAYGCQQMYITYSNRIFVRALTGNWTGSGPWSSWVEMYGPSNNPTPDNVNCIQRDGCHIGGFVAGDVAQPYMRHTASNLVVRLAKVGDSYTKAESDNGYAAKTSVYTKTESDGRYIQNIQLGAERSQGTHDTLATSKAPAGHVLNGIKSNYNDGNWEVDTIYFKPVQKYINGAWVTITG